jgi:hypothetical protein
VYVGVLEVEVDTAGARDARYVPDVDEYEGRYEEGVMELNLAVDVADDKELPSVPY